MVAKDRMTKEVHLVSPDTTVREAAQKMKAGGFGCLPVSENDRLVGIITDRDIAIRVVAAGRDVNATKVREVMSDGRVLYCYEDQHVSEVAHHMGDYQIRRLPVLNRQKRLVGILSLGDLAYAKEPYQAGEALCQISQRQHEKPMEIVQT